MSVNHCLLPIADAELALLLTAPATIHAFVENHASEICQLSTDGIAIMSLTAEQEGDPLTFMQSGGPSDSSGWIGDEDDQSSHFTYGPASYFKNTFVIEIAKRLGPWTVDKFAEHCDVDFLDQHNIYPGRWQSPGRKESLIRSFNAYRNCLITAAALGKDLLVWNE